MMDLTTKMKDEIRRRKAAQAATGLSILIGDELRHISVRFAGALRGARLHDVGAVRGKAVGYAERAGSVAARTYEHLAARGRDAMAAKGH